MNDEEILKRGIGAAQILNNEDLMSFISQEKELLLVSIANTQVHEVKTRESLYYQHHALTSFFEGLNQYIEAAERVVQAATMTKDETD
jgi:ABC-type histidine transport system ATPase subunit